MRWKELEDYSWFPQWLRGMQLSYIGWLGNSLGIYSFAIQQMQSESFEKRNCVDLCSGSGWAAWAIHQSYPHISIELTDLYPLYTMPASTKLLLNQHSVDVLNMQFSCDSFYTMFNAFHHFDEQQQLQIVKQMMESRADFFFVEILEPKWFSLLSVMVSATIGQLLFACWVKPFSISRLFFTYLFPINIITVLWDGCISVFKSKTKADYEALFQHCFASDYKIEVNKAAYWTGNITYIYGHATH